MNTIMNLRVPKMEGNFLASLVTVSFSRRTLFRGVSFLLVLYGCETWTLILREERKFRVSENRMLGRIREPNKEKINMRPWEIA
jgi:hypothetical protein